MANDHQESIEQPGERTHTQLFLVRVWEEQNGPHSGEWCGRVQHVLRGEAHSFVGWETLRQCLQEMMVPSYGPAQKSAAPDNLDATETP